MKHTPVVIVVDEVNTPIVSILTRCQDCDVTVTKHRIDVSKLTEEEVERQQLGGQYGAEDVIAFLTHCGQTRGQA